MNAELIATPDYESVAGFVRLRFPADAGDVQGLVSRTFQEQFSRPLPEGDYEHRVRSLGFHPANDDTWALLFQHACQADRVTHFANVTYFTEDDGSQVVEFNTSLDESMDADPRYVDMIQILSGQN
jgi:hypothetical protein